MIDNTKPATAEIPLPRLAAVLLYSALEQPGWATTARHFGCAFQLLEKVLLPPDEPETIKSQPRPQTQREMRVLEPAWASQIDMIPMSERQRETCKACLESLRNRGALPPGWATYALLEAFGLDADE